MFILLGALVALIVLGFILLARYEVSRLKRSALGISRERYTRGKLSKDDFEQMRKDLS
ncbi:SHOCT domain-containing protein [Chloroflexota bacterium]